MISYRSILFYHKNLGCERAQNGQENILIPEELPAEVEEREDTENNGCDQG
jgi:hypothetical protein